MVELLVPFCESSGVLVVVLVVFCEGCVVVLSVVVVLCDGCTVVLSVVVVLCDGEVAAGFCVVVVVVVWLCAKADTETNSANIATLNTAQNFLQSIEFSFFLLGLPFARSQGPKIEILVIRCRQQDSVMPRKDKARG